MSPAVRRLSAVALLSVLVPLAKAQKRASGCEEGQVIGSGGNAQFFLCSAAASALPEVRDQLARLAALSEKGAEQQAEVARFVRQINATGKLLDKRIDTLSASVSTLLQSGAGRTDPQLVRDVGTLARQLEDLRERIDSQEQNPETASRTRSAVAGDLGDALARLDVVNASRVLESLERIEKKIDDLGERIDCSSATPGALQLALKARMTDRVDALVRCRPELGSDETVGALVTEMFEDAKFQQSRPFLEGLWKDGLISSVGVCSCSHKAFQGRSILGGFDAVAWLLSRTPKGTLQSCDGFAGDLLEAMFWVGDKMMGVVSTLQNAGLQVDRDEYALFRTAYMQYVIYGYIKSVSDALAPPRRDLFLAAKAKTDAEVTSSYPFANVPSNDPNPGNLPGLRAVIRKRMAEYCPQRMSYCSAAPATR